MFNIGGGEMLAIFVIALVVLGPERLPRAMGQLGRYVGQLRQLSNGFQDEIRRAIDVDNAPFRPGEESHPVPDVDEVKVIGSGEPATELPSDEIDEPEAVAAAATSDPEPEPAPSEITPGPEARVDGRAPHLRAVSDPEDWAAG